MPMIKKITLSIILLTCSIVVPGRLLAVCLDDKPTVAEEYALSKSVFTAVVEDRVEVIDREGGFIEAHVFILRVRNQFKGSFPLMVVSYSENSSGRFDMDVGEIYLIFSNFDDNPITIDNCGHSDSVESAKDALQKVMELSRNDA